MHTLKKLYCRCFQISFRAALPLMPYREPKLIDGFSGVPKVLRKHSITRLLLVTDPCVFSWTDYTAGTDFEKAGITCIVYKDTVANPTSANGRCQNLYLKKHCQALSLSAAALPWTAPKESVPDSPVRTNHWPRWKESFMSCTSCPC